MMQTLLADLRLWQGNLAEAPTCRAGPLAIQALNDKFGMVQATAPLLRAQIALGQAGAAQRSTEELLTLAELSVQGPFPLMAVAGAAMHRGDGVTAVAIADRALAATDEMNGAAFEPHVARMVGLLQLDRVDEAMVSFAKLEPLALDPSVHQRCSRAVLRHGRFTRGGARVRRTRWHVPPARPISTRCSHTSAPPARTRSSTTRRRRPWRSKPRSSAHSMSATSSRSRIATNAYQHLIGRPHPGVRPTDPVGNGLAHRDRQPARLHHLSRPETAGDLTRSGGPRGDRSLRVALLRLGELVLCRLRCSLRLAQSVRAPSTRRSAAESSRAAGDILASLLELRHDHALRRLVLRSSFRLWLGILGASTTSPA